MNEDYFILIGALEDWVKLFTSIMDRDRAKYLEDFRFVYEGLGKEVPSPETVDVAIDEVKKMWQANLTEGTP